MTIARNNREPLRRADRILVGATVMLLALSALMIYSTTALRAEEIDGSSTAILIRHLIHIVIGLMAFAGAGFVPPARLRNAGSVFFVLALSALLVVLIPGAGDTAGGATRWLQIGPLRFQPGELAKIFVVLYFATYIGRHRNHMLLFMPGAIIPFAIVAAVSALFLLEPDFGSAAIIALVVFCQLVTVSRISHLFLLGAIAATGAAALVFTSAYRMRRLQSFLDPTADASGSGYQLTQSLIAVGSGGLTGQGLGAGQQKLYYLPAAHTDFIFAVISEELGLLGALAVIVLFLLIAYRGLVLARRLAADSFLSSLALGLTMLLVIPALLNIGVVTGVFPTKGLVLPLVAYGGTAMVANLIVMGLLIRLSREETP